MEIRRLLPDQVVLARRTFAGMSEVFGEDLVEGSVGVGEDYLADLLGQPSFWAYAALVEGRPVGGLTAHALPMTRAEATELVIYDLAVEPEHQRRGIGRALVDRLLTDAADVGFADVWVPADNDDVHALEFYRRTGGTAQAVTVFSYDLSAARDVRAPEPPETG